METLLPSRDTPTQRVSEHMERPALDDRSYRVIRLPNQLEALLIHDSETDTASAALDVNVGSFSDAADMPGMAHAVEHLLFMGTEKYPQENAYNQYLASHSGHSNAYTAATSTNYYFEVATNTPTSSKAPGVDSPKEPTAKSEAPLYGALDRFAQFFVKPLFLEDTLDRELKAVDSENKKNLQNDQWRLHQLNKSLANPKHPFNHFSTGNYKTLHDEPLARGVKIRDEFIKFYEKHYSANRMKLVVLGREELDELQGWVEELFSEVKDQNLDRNRWDGISPYSEDELLTQIFAKPVQDMRTLELHFPYPDEEELYDSQPGRYLSHLIGHEGPGSILAYLKSKGWANSLGAGASPLCPGSALFSISLRLTEDGLKNYKEVAKTVFQYVAMLKEHEPQEWIFDELKRMTEVNFRFKQKSPASKTTSKLSAIMQRPYPRDCILSGAELIRNFNPEGIKKGLASLNADNFRMTLVSQEVPGDWDSKEKWYGTEYKCERIPKDLLEEIRRSGAAPADQRPAELHLPHKNEFIPTRLDVEKKDIANPLKHPKLIRNDDRVRTWFKKDDRFWVPKANLHVTLRTPLTSMTPHTMAMAQLFQGLVQDSLVEYSYDAEIAGLDYSFSSHSIGLDVTVAGYSDKMAVLLEKVLRSVRDLDVADDRFAIVKERIMRGYKNWEFQQPYYQIGTYSRWLVSDRGWINEQLLAELPHITAEDVRIFYPQLLHQMHIEVLAHGNLHKSDALEFTDLVESVLRARKLPPSQWPIRRSLSIPAGKSFVYERTLKDAANINHCIEYILYVGNNQDRQLRARLLLFAQMADEPCFDLLRTKEQLGYVVFSGATVQSTWSGYRILIQSEKTPEYLEQRIDNFLTEFGKQLREMPEAKFQKHKTSVINKRLEKLKNLNAETGRFWAHIVSETYDFEQANHDAEHLEPLTREEMLAFFTTYIDPASTTRAKLAVHLLAQATAAASNIAATTDPAKKSAELFGMLVDFLTAEGVAVDKAKLAERLKGVNVADGSGKGGVEDLVKAVETYLLSDAGVVPDKADVIVTAGRKAVETALGAPAEGAEASASKNSADGAAGPIKIEDVHAWKASLITNPGPQPVQDLAEFEDFESKL